MREQARKRTVAAKAVKPKPEGKPKFWILWSPSSHKPPRVRFCTIEKVREVAATMVNKYHDEFYVMEAVELHSMGVPTITKCDGKSDKEGTRIFDPILSIQGSPSMQGQPWDFTQDEKLTRLFWEFRGYTEILPILARAMGRSELAIEFRLDSLGLRRRNAD